MRRVHGLSLSVTLVAVLALAWMLAPAAVAQAGLIASDSFCTTTSGGGSYLSGSSNPLVGQATGGTGSSGFTGSYTGSATAIYPQDTGLTYPAVINGTTPTPAGGAVYMSGSNVYAETALASPYTVSADNTYWFSVLYKTPSIQFAGLPANYNQVGLVNTSTTPAAKDRGFTIGGSGQQAGINVSRILQLNTFNGSTKNAQSLGNVSVSTPYWLLVRIDASTPTAQTVSAWVNPADFSNLGTPTGMIASNVIADVSNPWNSLQNLGFYCNVSTAVGGLFDEVRFGNTFADAVPEPASMVLLACGAVGLVIRRRK